MNVSYKSSFFRSIKKITDSRLKAEIEQAIASVKNAPEKGKIPNLKKMEGYKVHYRIKVGAYRIGITIEKNLVTFIRFGPRKDFYKFFP